MTKHAVLLGSVAPGDVPPTAGVPLASIPVRELPGAHSGPRGYRVRYNPWPTHREPKLAGMNKGQGGRR